MRATSLAAIATLCIATAPISARAADETITESFSVPILASAVPNVSQPDAQFESTAFPLFPNALGLLRSVSFTLSGPVDVGSTIADPEVFISLRGQMPMPIGTDQVATAGTTDLMFSGEDAPAGLYIGAGDARVRVTLSTNDAPNADFIESDGPLDGVVTYTYMPRTLVVVPETPTWAAMLVGFASLGFAGYRARRRTAA